MASFIPFSFKSRAGIDIKSPIEENQRSLHEMYTWRKAYKDSYIYEKNAFSSFF